MAKRRDSVLFFFYVYVCMPPVTCLEDMFVHNNWIPHTTYYKYTLDCITHTIPIFEDENKLPYYRIPYETTVEKETRVCTSFFTSSYINSYAFETRNDDGIEFPRSGDVTFENYENSTNYDTPCCGETSTCGKNGCYGYKTCGFIIWHPQANYVVRRGVCFSCQQNDCNYQCQNGEVSQVFHQFIF